VKRGLESLASQDLHCWDQRQLSQAWPLLGQPLNPKDQLVSKRMYEKLIGAKAFDNYLKVWYRVLGLGGQCLRHTDC
jgi:hypothetical protein